MENSGPRGIIVYYPIAKQEITKHLQKWELKIDSQR
jgi:hypothetical protein